MGTKVCSKCKEEKNIDDFGKDSTRPKGISYLCKICLIDKSNKYREKNLEKVLQSNKDYKVKNKESIKQKRKIRDKINNVKLSEYRKKYSQQNKDKINDWYKFEYQKNILYRIGKMVRSRINIFLRLNHVKKQSKTFEIIGCSPKFLKEYIEKKFTEGMSWGLMGKHIHIDHIIPLSSAKTEEEVYRLCHYTNLQPLWAEDNLKKGSKIL